MIALNSLDYLNDCRKAARKSLLILAAFFLSTITMAQSASMAGKTTEDSVRPFVRSVSLSFGVYFPSMDYYRETDPYFKSGTYQPSFSLEARTNVPIVRWLDLRIGAGYWRQEAEAGIDSLGREKVSMELNAIPISASLSVRFEKLTVKNMIPYAGIGGDFIYLSNKFSFSAIPADNQPGSSSGATFTGHVFAGLEAKLSKNFAIGGEFQYHSGNYIQQFYTDENLTDTHDETVSISGPRIHFSLIYLF